MKPGKTLAIIIVIVIAASSCGISEKEKQAFLLAEKVKSDSIQLFEEKFRVDSIQLANMEIIKNKEAIRSRLSDSLSSQTALLGRLQGVLLQTRSSIYIANDQMNQIKQFHFGRMPSEREEQIRNQEQVIHRLMSEQENLQATMRKIASRIAQIKAQLDGSQWSA